MKKKIKKAVVFRTNKGTIQLVRTEWIKARRKRMGLSQSEAARLAGMSNHIQWQKIESGTISDPQVSTLFRIAKALRCNPIELWNWREWSKK